MILDPAPESAFMQPGFDPRAGLYFVIAAYGLMLFIEHNGITATHGGEWAERVQGMSRFGKTLPMCGDGLLGCPLQTLVQGVGVLPGKRDLGARVAHKQALLQVSQALLLLLSQPPLGLA